MPSVADRFTRVANGYDRLNRILSLGLDASWLRRALAQLDRLLLTLQKAGLYGTLTPYPSSSVWFEICPDGFWKNVQTGADSGAYLTRDAYTPAP